MVSWLRCCGHEFVVKRGENLRSKEELVTGCQCPVSVPRDACLTTKLEDEDAEKGEGSMKRGGVGNFFPNDSFK